MSRNKAYFNKHKTKNKMQEVSILEKKTEIKGGQNFSITGSDRELSKRISSTLLEITNEKRTMGKGLAPIFNGRKSYKARFFMWLKSFIERLDVTKIARTYKFGIKIDTLGSGEKIFIPVVKEGNILSWTRICKVEGGEYFAIDLPVQTVLTRKECEEYIEQFKKRLSTFDDDKIVSSSILEIN